MSGVSLATKGLVSPEISGSTPSPPSVPALDLPPGFATNTSTASAVLALSGARIVVAVPTAINVCLIAAENITDNLRAQQASNLELPSLYKRAFLVAYETDEIALVRK